MMEKMGYGAGDMASNFYLGVINVFLLYYYTDVWGIDPASAAFMFLITKVIDAVSEAIGPDKVAVRVSPVNTTNGVSDSDPHATFTALAEALNGAPALVHHAKLSRWHVASSKR